MNESQRAHRDKVSQACANQAMLDLVGAIPGPYGDNVWAIAEAAADMAYDAAHAEAKCLVKALEMILDEAAYVHEMSDANYLKAREALKAWRRE